MTSLLIITALSTNELLLIPWRWKILLLPGRPRLGQSERRNFLLWQYPLSVRGLLVLLLLI